ncbi:MAG: hypothetical protein NTW19_12685 [Planctomycetota bacterium]|nr:hypothetical protein [Planctomycetota bacterium]
MAFKIDTSLSYADHFVEHGFCVVKGALSPEYCRRGIEEYNKAVGTDLPPAQWDSKLLRAEESHGRIGALPALQPFVETVYDQPGIANVIETMLGPGGWSGKRHAAPFICVFHEGNKREVAEWGHVDFVRVRIPVIGNAFVLQASLIDTEPFSGNITIYPGWHKILQKILLKQPDFWYSDDGDENNTWRRTMPKVEPYEFVAEAGDALLMHHLVGHSGNVNAAVNRTPRVAIHSQVIAKEWPNEIDAARKDLTPFLRSLAQNGSIKLGFNEEEVQAAAYKERRERRSDEIPKRASDMTLKTPAKR